LEELKVEPVDKITIKLVKTCKNNEQQQQDAKNNADL
jgi:hypothetical protein